MPPALVSGARPHNQRLLGLPGARERPGVPLPGELGQTPGEVEPLLAAGLQPSAVVDCLVQCSLRQMLDTGFFHADPHLGNLLVTPAGELTYVDFGMMSFLAPEQRYAIIEGVVHIVNRDFDALARLYQRLGFMPVEATVGTPPDPPSRPPAGHRPPTH